jgi:hypothetical protein
MTEEDETIWLSVLCARHMHFGHDTPKLDTIADCFATISAQG